MNLNAKLEGSKENIFMKDMINTLTQMQKRIKPVGLRSSIFDNLNSQTSVLSSLYQGRAFNSMTSVIAGLNSQTSALSSIYKNTASSSVAKMVEDFTKPMNALNPALTFSESIAQMSRSSLSLTESPFNAFLGEANDGDI